MKMTVITQNGQIQAFAHGSNAEHAASYPAKKDDKPRAGLRPLPGQEIHEVEVPDEVARIEDGQEIHLRLCKVMKKH